MLIRTSDLAQRLLRLNMRTTVPADHRKLIATRHVITPARAADRRVYPMIGVSGVVHQ
jgi:hypothetical protein